MDRKKFIRMNKKARAAWLSRNGMTEFSEKPKDSNSMLGLDLMIAFDTTGSMSSYIENVKKSVENLIQQSFAQSPNLRIGIVAFGDYCDMENSKSFGKAYQYLPLSTNKDEIVNFVKNVKNTSGGDGDEFYEVVIKKLVEETNWSDNNRVVLLIGDAAPHKVGYKYRGKIYDIDWKEEAASAKKANIKFNTVAIHTYEKWYKDLSKLTEGTYLPFKDWNNTEKLIEATVLAESGDATKELFDLKMKTETNPEMQAVYTSYSLKLI